MKKIVLFGSILIGNLTFAQVTLPYSTGFDSPALQTGWVQHMKAATNATQWDYSSANPNSAPFSLSHDYAPATGITLVNNWFVSPAFEIPSGGNLDSISYMFPGLSVPTTDDTVAIYLLQGSQDPDLANKILLFDFRDVEYIADNTYRTKTNLALDAYSGLSYLAIQYRSSDVSSYWLTVHFDDIAISGNTTSITDLPQTEQLTIYPNPTSGKLFIENELNEIESLEVVDLSGKVQVQLPAIQQKLIYLDLSALNTGLYIIKAKTPKRVLSKRVWIE